MLRAFLQQRLGLVGFFQPIYEPQRTGANTDPLFCQITRPSTPELLVAKGLQRLLAHVHTPSLKGDSTFSSTQPLTICIPCAASLQDVGHAMTCLTHAVVNNCMRFEGLTGRVSLSLFLHERAASFSFFLCYNY